MDISERDNIIEKPTLDQDKAFDKAWILIVKPLLEDLCLEQTKKVDNGKY